MKLWATLPCLQTNRITIGKRLRVKRGSATLKYNRLLMCRSVRRVKAASRVVQILIYVSSMHLNIEYLPSYNSKMFNL